MDLKNYIASETNCKLYLAEAKQISTFKGGGKAWVFQPENTEKLIEIVRVLSAEKIDFCMLGKGSNTLISDGICNSVLISTAMLCDIEIEDDCVRCECGASLANIIKDVRKHSLGGLEFLSGVPCSIGGAVRMNAGAFSAQTADYIYKMRILNIDCENDNKISINEVCADDLRFGYRKGTDGILLDIVLKLREKSEDESIKEAKRYISYRRKRQPSLPSLGSVFKNGKIPSGKLIDECGLKGIKIGGAKVSETHANFIVNEGGASASDYLALAAECKRAVFEETGETLEEEFVFVK